MKSPTSSAGKTDRQLPLAPRSIDPEALYRQYGPMVLRRCRRMLGDEDRARDAMHDVFVRLLHHQERLHGSAPSALLYRIATNVCLNKLRAGRRRPEVASDALADQVAPSADPERVAAARRILARLFGSQLESTALVAALRYQHGLTVAEVASAVGLSTQGVHKRLKRLRHAAWPALRRDSRDLATW